MIMRNAVAILGSLALVLAAARSVASQAAFAGGAATQGPLTAPLDGPKPAFEVAVVRPNTGPLDRMSVNAPPGRFTMAGAPLQVLLNIAFRVRPDQVDGIPDWVRTSRFDVNAKMPDGAPQDQLPYMLQSLLEDRFKLKWHTETSESDIYALVVARADGRLGPKLTKSEMDCKPIVEKRQAAIKEALGNARSQQERQAVMETLRPKPGEPLTCNTSVMPSQAQTPGGPRTVTMTLRSAGMELSNLITLLSSLSGRPVVDRTNLSGGFDVEFTFSPMMGRALTTALPGGAAPPAGFGAPAGPGAPVGLGAPVPSAADDGPTLFEALEEQLGLRLRSARGPVEYFIVDNIQQAEPD
jgi:uncharacterized protein (TIGR03435 family)